MNRYVAGRLPVSSRSYRGCVQSPLVELWIDAVGIPLNIDPVHAALSPGCALSQLIFSWAIPCQPEISPWLTTLPSSTSGTNAYESTRKPSTIPKHINRFFFITL